MKAVVARDLFKIYSTAEGNSAALQGLSLDVGEREIVVVLGPSGSGKTTLLRLLAALERPSAGSAVVLGFDVARLDGRAAARFRAARLGHADQHYARTLPPELTARTTVALPLALAGEGQRERLRRADGLLERVGLLGRAGALPRELSGGEQQRVALCAALARRPGLLLADEPTGELDAANAAAVYGFLEALVREERCSALVVSHDPASTEVADRVVHVRDGRVSEELARTDPAAGRIVVGRGGWLRLPDELLRRSGIVERAHARLVDGGIFVHAGDGVASPAANAAPAPVREASAVAPPVAELREVSKGFGRGRDRHEVLERLSASFEAGRLTVVTGPSGSGKTTLLRLLAGLDVPDEGDVLVAGSRISGLGRGDRAEVRRRTTGLVEQGAALVPLLSARENIELALGLRGVEGAAARQRAAEALAAVGLAPVAEQRVASLSAGERQRAAIARALAARPALLLADEPTARLDEANARNVAILLARTARELGAAVVCATHDPAVVEQADDELQLADDAAAAATMRAGRAPFPGSSIGRASGC